MKNSQIIKKIVFAVLLMTVTFSNGFSQAQIIPEPVEIKYDEGTFNITENTVLRFAKKNNELQALAEYVRQMIFKRSGYTLSFNSKGKSSISMIIAQVDSIGEEGYLMDVTAEQISIIANTEKGLFYGVQSLLQQLPAVRTNEPLRIPVMKIKDYPHIGWRGMMLDVSRHFYSIDAIKDIIDLLALYKMNVFHWHLTDNEGWRLEIKKYPKLTTAGAWRKEVNKSIWYEHDSTLNWNDTYNYGGFYTQEQARDLVKYAEDRNITIIPEIEMPGHSGAALAAYPQFSCNHNEQPVPNSAIFNKFNPTPSNNQEYCAGNDSSFLFLQDVLTEVMAIFPSAYIHIGGDEVLKTNWKNCARCQKRMVQENLKSEDELQSYFIHRIEKFLLANNRKLLGWDEILEGGLAPSATVMSWRGEKGGIEAAKMGHDVIMSPSNPLYFNRYQAGPVGEPLAAKYSINTLENVYHYTPYTSALRADQHKYIKGVQFAIWTEYIASLEHLEYMLLPRLPAIAEAAWSLPEKKDFNKFVLKLNERHFGNWQSQGVRYNTLHKNR